MSFVLSPLVRILQVGAPAHVAVVGGRPPGVRRRFQLRRFDVSQVDPLAGTLAGPYQSTLRDEDSDCVARRPGTGNAERA